jgi:hypothetical protein
MDVNRSIGWLSTRRVVTLLICLFMLRVVFALVIGHPWDGEHWYNWISVDDTDKYSQCALDLEDGRLDNPHFTTPGYPVIQMLTRSLLGWTWFGTIVVQQLAAMIGAFLLGWMLLPYIGRYAWLATLLFLLEPVTFCFSYILLPEPFMILIQIVSLWLMLKAATAATIRMGILTAVVAVMVGLGVLVKPILGFSYFGFILFILLFYKTRLSYKFAWVVLFFVLFNGPVWMLQDHYRRNFGIAEMSLQAPWQKAFQTLQMHQRAAEGRIDDGPIVLEMREVLESRGYDAAKPDYGLYKAVYDSLALATIRKYPHHMAFSTLINSFMYFNPAPNLIRNFLGLPMVAREVELANTKEIFREFFAKFRSWENLLFIAFSTSISLIMILSWLFSFRFRRRRQYWPLLFFINGWFVYTVLLVGILVDSRYRQTFIWGFAIAFALVAHWWFTERGGKKLERGEVI